MAQKRNIKCDTHLAGSEIRYIPSRVGDLSYRLREYLQ
jgi:hypothetical protein